MTARSIALILVAAAVVWLGAQSLGQAARGQRADWPRAQDYVYLPSPESAPIVWGNYRQVAADITWARGLVYYGSSLVGDADFRYLEQFIDNVIALDPKFVRPYKWAAYSVTFQNERATQEEFRVSIRYLEKGMETFPDDYEFFWAAGLRYYLDLYSDDPDERRQFRERGAELIEQAMRKENAPDDLARLAANLRVKLGQKERALADLREMILVTDNYEAQQALIERYNRLAGEDFPEEAQQAKAEFSRKWQETLPFTSPSMYVILGDRPSPAIDFEELATERDLFGVEPDLFSDPNRQNSGPDEPRPSDDPEPGKRKPAQR